MSDSSFKPMALPSESLEVKEIYMQIFNFTDAAGVNSSWAKCCLLEGLPRPFSSGHEEKAAGRWEMSVWAQPALGNPRCCSSINPYTPHHISLKRSNGWIQVSFKKAFPSAIFAWVFPLYTQFLSNQSEQQRRGQQNATGHFEPALRIAPAPTWPLPSHPIGFHSLLLGNYVFHHCNY